MNTKYCPNCLRPCTKSAYAGSEHAGNWELACIPCGVLLYSPSIVLDTPDKEKSKLYRVKKLLESKLGYSVTESDTEELTEKIRSIFNESSAGEDN